jgi:hypothetical protein
MGSKSKSSNATTSNINDSRTIATGSGNITRGTGNQVDNSRTTVITQTDHGAVKASFDAIESTVDDAFGFGTDALDTVEHVSDGAFELVQNTVEASLHNVETANESILDTTNNALTFAANSTRSDSALSIETLAKYGAMALVGYALVTKIK